MWGRLVPCGPISNRPCTGFVERRRTQAKACATALPPPPGRTRPSRPPVAITPAIAASPEPALSSPFPLFPRRRRNDRIGNHRNLGRQDHNLPVRSDAGTLTANVGFIAQAQMNNAPLAAAHWIEVERTPRLFDSLGCGHRAETQLFDSQ